MVDPRLREGHPRRVLPIKFVAFSEDHRWRLQGIGRHEFHDSMLWNVSSSVCGRGC